MEDGGSAAQMQVVDKVSGHMAATMEYLKATKRVFYSHCLIRLQDYLKQHLN